MVVDKDDRCCVGEDGGPGDVRDIDTGLGGVAQPDEFLRQFLVSGVQEDRLQVFFHLVTEVLEPVADVVE